MSVFQWFARVYWEDTDGGGIVYYANYLKFLERARTEWLRSLGFYQTQLAQDEGLVFTVVNLQVEYRRPARLDDELTITCAPRLRGSASILFSQRVYRGRLDASSLSHQHHAPRGGTRERVAVSVASEQPFAESLLVEAHVRVACVDGQTLRPRRMPEFLLNVLPAKELS